MTSGSVASVEGALESMKETLAADGYHLTVSDVNDQLTLAIEAGPDACAECLVPKSMFARLVVSALDEAGISMTEDEFDLVYPIDKVGSDH